MKKGYLYSFNFFSNLKFNIRRLRSNLFISITYFLFLGFSLFAGLYYYKNIYVETLDRHVYEILLTLVSISTLLAFLCLIKYRKKVKHAKIVRNAVNGSDSLLKAIEKEESDTLSLAIQSSHEIICNLDHYEKKRKSDLAKIKKIATKKATVCEFLIILMVVLAVLPILEFGLSYALHLLNVESFVIYLNHIRLNMICLAMVILNIILLTIFRRRKVVYYLLYFYIAVLVLLSSLL